MNKTTLCALALLSSLTLNAWDVAGFSIGANVDEVKTDLFLEIKRKGNAKFQDWKGFHDNTKDSTQVDVKFGPKNRKIHSIKFEQKIHNLHCSDLLEKINTKYDITLKDTGYNEFVYDSIRDSSANDDEKMEKQKQFSTGEIWSKLEVKCSDYAKKDAHINISLWSMAQRKENIMASRNQGKKATADAAKF